MEDMGERPEGMTVERVDNELGYSPENCRWATYTEQNNNKRDNHNITFNGVTRSLHQWEKHLGMRHGTLRSRLRRGWGYDQAISHPYQPYNKS